MFVGASSMACSWRMGITLLAFFGASSRLTQFREELKVMDESHRTGGQRDWQQVCNPCARLVYCTFGETYSSSLCKRVFSACIVTSYLHI